MRLLLLLILLVPLVTNGQKRENFDCTFTNEEKYGCSYTLNYFNNDTLTCKYFNCRHIHLKTQTFLNNNKRIGQIQWGPETIMNFDGTVYSTGYYYRDKKHGLFVINNRDKSTSFKRYYLDTIKEHLLINSNGDTLFHIHYNDYFKTISNKNIFIYRDTSVNIHIVSFTDSLNKLPKFKLRLDSFIYSHLKYPKAAKKDDICAQVYIHFTITNNGEIKNAECEGPGTDPEIELNTLQAIKATNKLWVPGEVMGEKIDVEAFFSIYFITTL